MNDRQDQDFNAILIESIHETIAQLLSVKVAKTLFEHLEKAYSVNKDQVPAHLDTLLLALEKNFGSSSSQVIGKAIAKRLYSQLGIEFFENAKLAQQK